MNSSLWSQPESISTGAWLRQLGAAPASSPFVAWVPAPVLDLATVVRHLDQPVEMAFCAPGGVSTVGLGSVAQISAEGSYRFAQMERDLSARLRAVRSVARGDRIPPGVRMYGGFAFSPGAARHDAWAPFGDARFSLPRLVYTRQGTDAWLGLAHGYREGPVSWNAAVERLLSLERRLREPASASDGAAFPLDAVREVREAFAADALADRLTAARQAVADGIVAKVVVSASMRLTLSPPPVANEVLARLLADNPASNCFAVRAGDSCFLGATPERLVTRQGRRIDTEALASSLPRDRLRGGVTAPISPKDRAEHRFVVEAIVSALTPLTTGLDVATEPRLHELCDVVHLRTPISGQLRQELHVLSLVARLHPTPAVGGTPTAAALAWLGEHEPAPRGWYASPVGWVNAEGDGDFVVALRAGLLADGVAELQAGAGIVLQSDPTAELAEIRLKLGTFRAALGVSR